MRLIILKNDKIMKRTISLSSQSHLQMVKDDIAHGITLRFVAKSNSMRPFIVAERDEVILKLVDENSFQKGAILFAELGEKHHVAHRLIEVEGDNLVLRGDANLKLIEMCGRDDVIAEVVAVVRKGRKVKKGSPTWNFYRYFWPKTPQIRKVLLHLF